jgi:DMSO/TMAO reductase YedYZ molybdopterin-dependent catalytic subunit
MAPISRRAFLSTTLLSAGAALALGRLAWSRATEAVPLVPGKEDLIIRSLRFYDLEAPVALLDSWITPVSQFFVRNHMSEPTTFDADAYRLIVTGEVEHPLSLTLADLKKLATTTVVNTLECAGNGRAFYQPHVPGVQWQRGAVGTARYTGPRLKDVLAQAGLKLNAKHVAFKGLDEPPGKVPPFIRSIPIEKALDPDTLLAMQMNGAPLLIHHGYPVRALVPGWIGAASCKWLTEIRVLEHGFDGNFMKPGYRIPKEPIEPGAEVKPEDTVSITGLNVKSLITHPAEGAMVKTGSIEIKGAAWAGEADVTKVEVSIDGGRSWNPAQFGADRAKYAWRFFEYRWKPGKSGDYTLMARATDSRGRVQPAKSPWNPSGYLWNGIDEVNIHVES